MVGPSRFSTEYFGREDPDIIVFLGHETDSHGENAG